MNIIKNNFYTLIPVEQANTGIYATSFTGSQYVNITSLKNIDLKKRNPPPYNKIVPLIKKETQSVTSQYRLIWVIQNYVADKYFIEKDAIRITLENSLNHCYLSFHVCP